MRQDLYLIGVLGFGDDSIKCYVISEKVNLATFENVSIMNKRPKNRALR